MQENEMKTIILFPRLDVPFKNLGPVPEERGMIVPIRQHWANFRYNLSHHLVRAGHQVEHIEKPLWQFTPKEVDGLDCDVVFIPHKEPHNFPVENKKALYYMQTVIPTHFSIDPNGWGSNLSTLPIDLNQPPQPSKDLFDLYRKRIDQNISKFDQFPKKDLPFDNYILFLCQIPHDETIKYHSEISVADALKATIDFAHFQKLRMVVKGHPVNQASMEPLREIAMKNGAHYIDNVSIHSCIEKCLAAFTVNSGSGIEVLMHYKPLFTFGNSEYKGLVPQCNATVESIQQQWESAKFVKYPEFFYGFMNSLYDSENLESFKKLEDILKIST